MPYVLLFSSLPYVEVVTLFVTINGRLQSIMVLK